MPHAPGKAVHEHGTEGRGVFHLGADHGRLENVGLELHEELVLRGTAVGTDFAQTATSGTGHHVDEVLNLVGYRLQGGAQEVGTGGGKRHAEHGPLHVLLPPRGTKAREGGHDVDAAVVVDRRGLGFHGGGLVDEFQLVANPLERGAGAVDIAFVTVEVLAQHGEAHTGDEALGSGFRLFADVDHHRRTGAVGHLARPRREAHLSGQCTVAVAQHAGNLDGLGKEPLAGGLAIDGVARQHLGHHASGDAEEAEQVVVPLHGVDIEEHGSRGVGGVGGKGLAAGEFPYEPRVDGAHEQVAAFGSLAGALNVVEQPRDAGGREVRVDEQAALLLHHVAVAFAAQLLTELGTAGVLPHHGARDRLARVAVPHHDRFALVGDGNGASLSPSLFLSERQLLDGGYHVLIDFLGIVLHPSGLRIVLLVVNIAAPQHPALLVEEHGLGRRCALVNGNDSCARHSHFFISHFHSSFHIYHFSFIISHLSFLIYHFSFRKLSTAFATPSASMP